jgi:hypothetical protein
MSELLNEVRRFELDEGFSPREIKMAIGIASDPRYAKGNMTGAVTAIERMKKGLSKHPQVMAVLKRQNEDFDEGYKPVKSNHFDVKIQGVKKKDVEAILKYIKQDGGNYDIEDVDDDQVRGGGSSGTSDGDIFIQGDDAGKLGMEIAKKFRGVKVMGENFEVGTKSRRDHTLNTTPGQSPEEFEKQVETMQAKNNYMREALAKMWGIDEGKNPFVKDAAKKQEEKKVKAEKTMTGKKATEVKVDPDLDK